MRNHVDKAIKLDNSNRDAHWLLGHLLYDSKEPSQAYLEYERALIIDPLYVDGKISWMECYLELNMTAKQAEASLKTQSSRFKGRTYSTLGMVIAPCCFILPYFNA